jgi:hypothetical protein
MKTDPQVRQAFSMFSFKSQQFMSYYQQKIGMYDPSMMGGP